MNPEDIACATDSVSPAGPWSYQERVTDWCVWALGARYHDGRGWECDTFEVFVGPLTFVFMRYKEDC